MLALSVCLCLSQRNAALAAFVFAFLCVTRPYPFAYFAFKLLLLPSTTPYSLLLGLSHHLQKELMHSAVFGQLGMKRRRQQTPLAHQCW